MSNEEKLKQLMIILHIVIEEIKNSDCETNKHLSLLQRDLERMIED